jgi:hypothetical protein
LALAEVSALTSGSANATGKPDRRNRQVRGRVTDTAEQPRRSDREALAAMIQRAAPDASVHPPSGYVPPNVVVLATDGPPDQVQARDLIRDRIPHLAARASELRGVVGPFVLPGRSSCLHCHDLHRRDADPGWPRVLMALQNAIPVPPAVLATSVAALAAGQVLQFLDGRRAPDSIDGTLELRHGEWLVRRRSWKPHPGCFCQSP